jgi:hypothetical protein
MLAGLVLALFRLTDPGSRVAKTKRYPPSPRPDPVPAVHRPHLRDAIFHGYGVKFTLR